MPLLGMQAEGARTNLCLQSNDPSNASWTKSSFITTTQNAVSPDGATNAWTIAATTGATFAVFLQNITVAANTNSYTASCFVKKTTGTPATYPMFELQHSSATKTAGVVINTTAGTLTNRSVGGAIVAPDAKTITSWNDAYWRVTVTLANNSGTTSTIAFYPSINSDGTGVIVSGTLGSAVFYGAQVELGAFASTYIPTTTVAVTRNAEIDSVPTAGNIAAAQGWIYMEYTPTHAPSGTVFLWGTYVDANNYTAVLHDATNLIFRKRIASVNYDATIANAFTTGTTYKMAATWSATTTMIALNGTAGTPSGNGTAAQIGATMQFGADGNGANQPFMSLRNERIGQSALSAAQLQGITT